MRAHNPNGISISSAIFAQMTVECTYTLQWDALLLQKTAPSHVRIWTPIYYMVPWAHHSPQPKWHLEGSTVFGGLTSVTDRQTMQVGQ